MLTPRYLNSEWCTKEIHEFCRIAQSAGSLVVDNKCRVFKVIKTPVDREESLPTVVQKLLGYEFFLFEGQAPLELDPDYGDEFKHAYLRKVATLASDMSELLKRLDGGDNGDGPPGGGPPQRGYDLRYPPEASPGSKPSIYLAECSRDRREEREIVEAELRHHGHTVLPHQQLPNLEEDYIAEVDRQLARCRLSIHLVGNSYGVVPDGPNQKSVVVLQNELAARHSRDRGLARVIWLPDGTNSEQDQQRAFIEALRQDAEAQFGADLITGDLETLKGTIHAELKKRTPERPDLATSGYRRLVYLICDEKDLEASLPLRKFLNGQGLEVAIPVFEGDATAVREGNEELLETCDAVVLYYGTGNEAWKNAVENELRKTRAYRGAKPLLASYTYLADPLTAEKQELLKLGEPTLIDSSQGFSEKQVSALLQANK